jgi:DNA-binding MarR family transcriptional regulator
VLRILRGAGETGLCRTEVMQRLISKVPDTTRLLDRMEAAGLIERERSDRDRRFVTTRVTAAGLSLLAELDDPVKELHRLHLGVLDRTELRTLIASLERVRATV